MAKNTGRGYREGEVRDRSQVYNPVTKTWTNSLGAKKEATRTKESAKSAES